ncbi:MAG: universal stress protein [Alphaproteobacteria bacterium]
MRKLLVAVDGSECSLRALAYAIGVAKAIDSLELYLVSVHPDPDLYGDIQIHITRERMLELQREHCKELLQPAVDAAKAAGVRYKSEILMGDTAPVIAKRAGELGCDGIVMGTRGMTAIANLVLGSTATKVIHVTTLPVTLVR